MSSAFEPLKQDTLKREHCTLTKIQYEVGTWAQGQFHQNHSKWGKYVGVELRSIPPLMGIMGEVGELVQQDCKRHQGRIKGVEADEATFKEEQGDALADMLIFMCDYASREDINLSQALEKAWAKVQHRTAANWQADKAKETEDRQFETPEESMVSPTVKLQEQQLQEQQLEQTGQGFAEPPEEEESRLDWGPITEELVERAIMVYGWTLDKISNQLVNSADVSCNWAASWQKMQYKGQTIQVPHWLPRRIKELHDTEILNHFKISVREDYCLGYEQGARNAITTWLSGKVQVQALRNLDEQTRINQPKQSGEQHASDS